MLRGLFGIREVCNLWLLVLLLLKYTWVVEPSTSGGFPTCICSVFLDSSTRLLISRFPSSPSSSSSSSLDSTTTGSFIVSLRYRQRLGKWLKRRLLMALYSLGSLGVCLGLLGRWCKTADLYEVFFSLNSLHLCLSFSLESSLKLPLAASHALPLCMEEGQETSRTQDLPVEGLFLILDGGTKWSSDVWSEPGADGFFFCCFKYLNILSIQRIWPQFWQTEHLWLLLFIFFYLRLNWSTSHWTQTPSMLHTSKLSQGVQRLHRDAFSWWRWSWRWNKFTVNWPNYEKEEY